MRSLTDPRLRGWLPLLAAGAVYAGAIGAAVAVKTAGVSRSDEYSAVREQTTSDFRDYWFTANHLRDTGQLTTQFGVHNYVPFFAVFMLPWSFLPLPVGAALFALLSLALFGVTVVLVQTLLNDGLGPRPRVGTLLALALALPYVHSCATLGNVGLLVLFLVVAAWFLVERGREWEAGLALGLAVLIKLLPGVLLVFLLLRRRFRVAGAAVAVVVVLGLGLPLLTLGPAEAVRQHWEFYKRAAGQHSAYQTITADQPLKAKFSNNALPIVLRRLLSPVNGGADDEASGLYVNVADVPRRTIFIVYAILVAVFALASVMATLRSAGRWPPAGLDELCALRAQFGVWCCLMLLLAPLVWTHYLPLAYWPLALLADRAERTRLATRRVCRASAATLVIWLVCAVLLAWPAARAAGAQLASVTALWAALVWITLRRGAAHA